MDAIRYEWDGFEIRVVFVLDFLRPGLVL